MKSRYNNLSDIELISLLRGGEENVTDFIMEKYKNLVRSKARSMYILGADNDDLIQEGMIGLFKAIRDFDCGKEAGFYTFAELCISRQMYKAIQASKRQKHAPLNGYVPLDGEYSLVETLLSTTELNPEDIVIHKESASELKKKIEEQLSFFERQVFDLYLTGMTYTQIAKVLDKEEKATDNALQRVKTKVKKVIKDRKM